MEAALTLAGFAKRLAGATGLALATGGLCGVFLVTDVLGEAHGVRLARRATSPPVEAPRIEAVVRGDPAVVPAPAPAPVAPVPRPVAPADPRDLARELPEPSAATQLAAMLRDPDTGVAVAAAAALGRTREGRPVLVAHLARLVDAPGLDHLACLEALAEFGRVEDLPTVMLWTERHDSVGDLAGWCVRAICERERVDPPVGLRAPVPDLDVEVRPGA